MLLHLLFDPVQTWQRHLAQTLLFDWMRWIWINICFSCYWWRRQHDASFWTNTVPFSRYLSKILLFDTDYENYAIVEISTKKRIICGTESINMWIWADEIYRFSDFSTITSSWRYSDFILDIWVQIWDQSIKSSIYAEFQLIMLSID